MNRRQKIIVSVTGIFIVLLALVGLTYAYFLTKITGNTNDKSISVSTANLSVTYQDGDNEIVTVEKVVPDTVVAEKVFYVKNTGTAPTTYSIILDNIENNFERNQDLVYTLTKEGETNPVVTGNIASGSHQIIIPKVDIALNATDTYTFKLEYVEAGVDQSKDMNSTVSFRINIDNEATTWDNSEPTWLNDGEQTLISAIKSTSTYVEPENLGVTANTSIPGVRESLEEERIISSIEDDYGTSYYYRGNIENNYVNYSGMCWRIVRIQGDGTIKLALADEDYECNESGALASGMTSTIGDYPRYTRFQYTDVNSLDENGNATMDNFNYENSIIRQALIAWMNGGTVPASVNGVGISTTTFEQNFTDTSKLVETDWCNNIAISKISDGDTILESYSRLGNSDETLRMPKIKCNSKGLNNSKSVRVKDIIGILTADEFALAGGVNYKFNTSSTHYLIANTTYGMATMTPSYLSGTTAAFFKMDISSNRMGTLMNMKTSEYQYLRPVIVVDSDVILDINISGQNGTASNPFVIY